MATITPPAPAVDADAGILTLPPRCKPSKACSTDRTRPTLTHAYLRKHKGHLWLCATNSYIAVAIQVEGTSLAEGWVPIGALRLMERGQLGAQIGTTAWRIETNEGAVTFDIAADVRGSKYPDFNALGLWSEREPEALSAIGMNPRLMTKIADALGATDQGCCFEFTGARRSIRVTPTTDGDGRIGLQMPCVLHT